MISEYYKRLPLPQCAVTINGVTLEEEFVGYRTSSVDGREQLTTELKEAEIGFSNGSEYRRKRFPSKDLTVVFNLVTDTRAEHHRLLDAMKLFLNTEHAQIIFADESDKFYIGTIKTVATDKIKAEGSDVIASSGKMTIRLSDPFKYSVEEKIETVRSDGSFVVDYNGTYPAYPTFEATFSSDNGYLGFVNDEGKILQFGNPDETDSETYKQSEQLGTLESFRPLADDPGRSVMHPQIVMNGTLDITYIPANQRFPNCFRLVSTPNVANNWHGGMRTLTLPPDSEGKYGAKTFYCWLDHWIETGLNGQTGLQSISFLTDDNQIICGYSLFKNDMTGNSAMCEMWLNNRPVKLIHYTPSHLDHQNPYNNGRGYSDILKEGDTVKFYWFGSYPQFSDPAIKDMECTKIQVAFAQFGARNLSTQYVTRNYLRSIDFYKYYVEKQRDVPNQFMSGYTFYTNCRNGEVLCNELPAARLGDVANDWDDFYLSPGLNQIKRVYSEWAEEPEVVMKYREVFI